MELQPPRKRAAQAFGVIVGLVGGSLLVGSLPVMHVYGVASAGMWVVSFTLFGLGLALLLGGRRLLAWGSGDHAPRAKSD